MVYYNVMVNIPVCYSNPTIVNIYWHYRKLVYKIIVNGGGYRITYFVAGYWIASPYITPNLSTQITASYSLSLGALFFLDTPSSPTFTEIEYPINILILFLEVLGVDAGDAWLWGWLAAAAVYRAKIFKWIYLLVFRCKLLKNVGDSFFLFPLCIRKVAKPYFQDYFLVLLICSYRRIQEWTSI